MKNSAMVNKGKKKKNEARERIPASINIQKHANYF